MVVVVVRCPADPIQQDEKGCGGQGWGAVSQVMLQPGVPPSSGTPKAAQTPEAEACGVGGGKQGLQGPPCPRLPSYPNLPKPRLAHLTKGRAAKGCCLDQMAVFVDMDQVLAEGPAAGHMDYGHTVLQQKSRDQVRPWCPLHLPGPREDGGSPRQSRQRTLQASSWSSIPSGCTQPPPGSQPP